jgi:hypothetical protein
MLATPGPAAAITTAGDYAYIACEGAGLVVADISDPVAPQLAAVVDTPGIASGVTMAGSLVYVADQAYGMHIIDVSNPLSPVMMGSVETPGLALDIAISGSTAYVADLFSGVAVIDISDPASPIFLHSLEIGAYATDIAVLGSQAYVLNYGDLIFLDISDPVLPVSLGSLGLGDELYGIAITPQYLYVTGFGYLRIVELCKNPILETITLLAPANNAVLPAAPTFSWIVDGGSRNAFSVEFAVSPGGRIWSTFEDLHLVITENFWTMPAAIWNRIPSGIWIYWRVQGTDRDQTAHVIIPSEEVWRFRKE